MHARVLRCLQRSTVVVVLVLGLISAGAKPALGDGVAGWPLHAPARTQLGFGSAYDSGPAGERTHSGTDLAAEAGAEVLAPFDAEVAFAGRVPSGSGATVPAVTLVGAQGERLTLMPLADLRVRAGERISSGATVARVADTGDPSSDATHLHVGLRVGSLYIDPLSRLRAPSEPVAEPAPSPGSVHAAEPAPAPLSLQAQTSVPAPPKPEAPRARIPEADQSPTSTRSQGHDATRRASEREGSPSPAAAAAAAAAGAAALSRVRATGRVGPATGDGASTGFLSPTPLASRSWLPAVNLAELGAAVRARDRLLGMAASYLLATIAAAGLIAWAVRARPTTMSSLEPGTVPVREG